MKTRSEISNDYKWDLTKIFETKSDFDKFYDETKKLIIDYKKYEGHTMDDAKTFYNSIVDSLEISRRLGKLYTYAHMKSDEDVSLNSNQELVSRVINLYNLASQAMYFEETELLKEDYSKIEEFFKEEPRLLEHEINIKNSFRYKNHILSDAEEKIMSNLNGAFDNNETTYSYLTNSDMTFGTIKDESGNEVELTDTNYSIFIESKDRCVRIDAFKTLYKYYKQFTNTITSTLNGNIKESVAVSHIRKYNSAFERSLFNDEMDPKVFKTLVDTVHENLDIYQKYYDLKKEVLGLDEIHLYDVYAKLINDYDKTYSFDEAKELVFKALSVMGEEYTNDLEKAFSQKWIDIYPNKNKRGGAYSSGSYDTYPYVLLNYQGRLNDVSTIIHELGHSMHSYYTRNNQPYQYGNYPIFVAEVASTVNEMLLAKYLLKNSDDKSVKLAVLNHLLELFKATIYRQVMFAEFEKYAYDLVENDDVITSEKLCNKYLELNKEYFGKNVVVDEEIKYEWEKVPHFYSDFYVYKYATGLSAACKIVNGILNHEDGALENYIKMLKNGCRENPLNTLKIAGVDMTDKEVYQSAIDMFNDAIEDCKVLLKTK